MNTGFTLSDRTQNGGVLPKLLAVVVAVAAGFFGYNYFLKVIPTVEVAQVIRGKAVSAVYATVNVQPTDEVIIKTRDYGNLVSINVKANDRVKVGQPLAEIRDSSLQSDIDITTSQLEQARLKAQLGPPSLPDLKTKQDDVKNLKRLLDAQNISPVEYSRGLNELQSLQDRVKAEQIGLDGDVTNLQNKLKGLTEQLKQTVFTSPIDGLVLDIYQTPGDTLPPNTQILRVGSASNQIVASVMEEDIGMLQPGMPAQLRLFSQPDNLAATLKEILPAAVDQKYQVVFTLDKPNDNLLPGMTGEMNIITGQRDNALLIPTRAVRNQNQVLMVANGKVEEREVKTGFRSIERVEILEGLQEGDLVILSDQDMYKPGMRVQAKIKEE